MRSLKKMLVLSALTLVLTVVFADGAWAAECGTSDTDPIMKVAACKAVHLFKHTKGIIFIVGGFGLVGIAFQAIFGKVKWSWFAGLAVGLGILAAADAVINYATGDWAGNQAGLNDESGEYLGDTFTNAGVGEVDDDSSFAPPAGADEY